MANRSYLYLSFYEPTTQSMRPTGFRSILDMTVGHLKIIGCATYLISKNHILRKFIDDGKFYHFYITKQLDLLEEPYV